MTEVPSASRLASIDPDMVAALLELNPELRRAVTRAVIVSLSPLLVDARFAAALDALRADGLAAADTREHLHVLTAELDDRAWTVQEQSPAGDTYLRAFREARAANALWYALDKPSLGATLECVYEAQAAHGGLEDVRRVIRSIVN